MKDLTKRLLAEIFRASVIGIFMLVVAGCLVILSDFAAKEKYVEAVCSVPPTIGACFLLIASIFGDWHV